MSFKKNIFIVCFIVLSSVLSGQVCVAQKIELKDVAKIQLIQSGSWMAAYYRSVEVVSENGEWKSYQTRLYSNAGRITKKNVRDSSRTFVRNVPDYELKQLLTYLSKPDTAIDYSRFHIKTEDLLRYVDSTIVYLQKDYLGRNVYLNAFWRQEFIKLVKSKPLINNTLYEVLHPIDQSDRTWYYIIIANKSGKTDTITTDVVNEAYHLPWTIINKQSYNPDITRLFELMSGNYGFAQKQEHELYNTLTYEIYDKQIKPKMDWDKFKIEHPEAYAWVSKTLKPIDLTRYEPDGFSGSFTSSLLPPYMRISCSLSMETRIFTNNSNKLEQTLIAYYNKGGFLFDYVKNHPHTRMYFSTCASGAVFEGLIKKYPKLAKFNRTQVIPFFINHNADYENMIKWILLPDNTVMLTRYRGELANNINQKFELIPPKRKYGDFSRSVSLIYDRKGKKIGGSMEPFTVKKPE